MHADFLRYYNPDLKGFATGKCSITEGLAGSVDCPNSFLNAVVSGSESRHILCQASRILNMMTTDPRRQSIFKKIGKW
eukprot:m.29503 g.29503  ORF g.29503 m.29503 type:complete len:78 (+) comp31176_c0_seq1:1-234(+)